MNGIASGICHFVLLLFSFVVVVVFHFASVSLGQFFRGRILDGVNQESSLETQYLTFLLEIGHVGNLCLACTRQTSRCPEGK